MLILARKAGQAVVIADEIRVRVLEIKGGQVRLGVEAPEDMMVHREEIYLRIMEENRKAAAETPDDLAETASLFQKRGGGRAAGNDGRE